MVSYLDDKASSDVSTDNPAARSQWQRVLISQLSLADHSPPQSNQDAETFPPRHNTKAKKKVGKKGKSQKALPAVIKDKTATDGAASEVMSTGENRHRNVTGQKDGLHTLVSRKSPVNDNVDNVGDDQDGQTGRGKDNLELPIANGGNTNAIEKPRIKPRPKP